MGSRHRKRRPDLDERVSVPVQDPEEALRKVLRQPPIDKRDKVEPEPKPDR